LTALAVGSWVLAGLLVLGAYNYMEMRKSHQNSRNGFLRTEIASLEDEIKEIEQLRARRDSLISRMEVIQGLQRNRTELVQIVDDLVHLIPEGVYLTRITKRDESMVIEGRAQSNARVSNLMENLEDSDWFHGPRLDVINVREDSEGRISAFTLQVSRAGRPKADDDQQSG
jgi:type IV pilus assembly protein PilN